MQPHSRRLVLVPILFLVSACAPTQATSPAPTVAATEAASPTIGPSQQSAGTVKVHEGNSEQNLPADDPKVCQFHIHFFLGAGTSGDYRVETQPGDVVVLSGPWDSGSASDVRVPTDPDVFSLPDGQYKLYWDQTGQTGGSKQKVFQVDCLTPSDGAAASSVPSTSPSNEPSASPLPTSTPDHTLKPEATPFPTPTPAASAAPTYTPNPTAIPHPTPTVTPSPSPTAIVHPSPTPEAPTVPIVTPAPTSSPGPTAGPTPHPTAAPTARPTSSPTPGPTSTPTAHPTSTPTGSVEPEASAAPTRPGGAVAATAKPQRPSGPDTSIAPLPASPDGPPFGAILIVAVGLAAAFGAWRRFAR